MKSWKWSFFLTRKEEWDKLFLLMLKPCPLSLGIFWKKKNSVMLRPLHTSDIFPEKKGKKRKKWVMRLGFRYLYFFCACQVLPPSRSNAHVQSCVYAYTGVRKCWRIFGVATRGVAAASTVIGFFAKLPFLQLLTVCQIKERSQK